MKRYYSFVYLDEDAVQMLFSQVYGDIVEQDIEYSNLETMDSSVNTGLLEMLSSKISSKGEFSFSKKFKYVPSPARMTQMLIDQFKTDNIFIQDIVESNQPFEESIYFVGKGTFFLSDMYNQKTGESLFVTALEEQISHINPNDNSVIVLEMGKTYFVQNYCSDQDNLLIESEKPGCDKYGIMMHVSNAKMKKNFRHLTWEIKKAKKFDLYVFGEIVKCGDILYKISPFAIWR